MRAAAKEEKRQAEAEAKKRYNEPQDKAILEVLNKSGAFKEVFQQNLKLAIKAAVETNLEIQHKDAKSTQAQGNHGIEQINGFLHERANQANTILIGNVIKKAVDKHILDNHQEVDIAKLREQISGHNKTQKGSSWLGLVKGTSTEAPEAVMQSIGGLTETISAQLLTSENHLFARMEKFYQENAVRQKEAPIMDSAIFSDNIEKYLLKAQYSNQNHGGHAASKKFG